MHHHTPRKKVVSESRKEVPVTSKKEERAGHASVKDATPEEEGDASRSRGKGRIGQLGRLVNKGKQMLRPSSWEIHFLVNKD